MSSNKDADENLRTTFIITTSRNSNRSMALISCALFLLDDHFRFSEIIDSNSNTKKKQIDIAEKTANMTMEIIDWILSNVAFID